MSNAAVPAAPASDAASRLVRLAPLSSAAWSSSSPISGCWSSSSFRSSSSSRFRCRRRRSPCRPMCRCSTSRDGIGGFFDAAQANSVFDNYVWLTEDALYFNAYVSSVVIAGISTVLTLLVGYPIAYGMARAPATLRPTLLMLVILPFWTSFLIRVYAWIGILKPEGLLNQLLLAARRHRRAADHPQHPHGDLHRHRLFLSAVHDPAALFGAGEDGLFADRGGAGSRLPADRRLLEDHLPAVAARRRRRLHAGLHSGRRRVRHPRSARRLADADDRQDAVERVLRQPRLAGVLGGGRHPAAAADRADHDLPAGPGARPGAGRR